jgi:hypothetical protein
MFSHTDDLGPIPVQNIVQSLADIKHEIEELNRTMEKVRRENPGADVSELQGRARVAVSRRDTLRGQLAQQNTAGYASVFAEKQAFKVARGEINAINARLGMDALAGRRASVTPNEMALAQSLHSPYERASNKYNEKLAAHLQPRRDWGETNRNVWDRPTNLQFMQTALQARPGWNEPRAPMPSVAKDARVFVPGPEPKFKIGGGKEFKSGFSRAAQTLGFGNFKQGAGTTLATLAGISGVSGLNDIAWISAAWATNTFVGAAATGAYIGQNVFGGNQQMRELLARQNLSLYGGASTTQYLKFGATGKEIDIRQTIQRKFRDAQEPGTAYRIFQGGENIAAARGAEINREKLNLEQKYKYGFEQIGGINATLKQRAIERDDDGQIATASLAGDWFGTNSITRGISAALRGTDTFSAEAIKKRMTDMQVKQLEAREKQWKKIMERELSDPTHQVNNYENLLRQRQVEDWQFEKSMQWNTPE